MGNIHTIYKSWFAIITMINNTLDRAGQAHTIILSTEEKGCEWHLYHSYCHSLQPPIGIIIIQIQFITKVLLRLHRPRQSWHNCDQDTVLGQHRF